MPSFNVAIGDYVVDAVWPEHKLIVELDSYAFHDRTVAEFEYERERHTELHLDGWEIVRQTSGQMGESGRPREAPAQQVGRARGPLGTAILGRAGRTTSWPGTLSSPRAMRSISRPATSGSTRVPAQ